MRRGSTPLNQFNCDIDLSGATIFVSYEQNDVKLLEKTGDEVSVIPANSGCVVQVHLSQAETLLFSPGTAYAQIRYVTEEGAADASNIVSFYVGRIIKDGEIYYV